MSRYRRSYVDGGTYFPTLVTHRRMPLFVDASARRFLREAIASARHVEPFELIDLVLLPDHLHLIVGLPDSTADFPSRVSRIKTGFTRRWSAGGGAEADQSASRQRQGYRGVWQKRSWEHVVRDEADLTRCRAYVYNNPVKHGLSRCPHEWPWSSSHRAVAEGELPADWRCVCDGRVIPSVLIDDLPGAEMDL